MAFNKEKSLTTHMDIRNIAIIAHVDHGKTTITDAILKLTGMVEEDASMDSNKLEKERGITIYAKNASIIYKGTKINIVDTPGHADFGSEVERVLRSIDSVILVVDAQEGPMPQTKFVLKKSLELGLKPIVVINKIDKPAQRAEEVKEMVFELFLDLGATDEQLDFVTIYAAAREGVAKKEMNGENLGLTLILDTVLEKVQLASTPEATEKPFRMQPFNLAYDNFLGRLGVCRVHEGKVKTGQTVTVIDNDGAKRTGRIAKLFTFQGLKRVEATEVVAGDIVLVAGLPDIYIGETICASPDVEPLPAIKIDEPTIQLNFLVNNSPFAGREGKFVTNSQIKERLEKELEINVGLKVDFSSQSNYVVSGRGELHIAILLENMRREGFEVQVSQPVVIIKEENGKKLEPFEEVIIDLPSDMVGPVIEKLSKRKGIMGELKNNGRMTRLIFEVPTRGLLGYRGEFIIDTKGEGIMTSRVIGFKEYAGDIQKTEYGSMISMATGKSLAFSLWNLQERGSLYIHPTTEVYEGMVIGNVSKGNDLSVNPTKGKKLTNTRSSGADEAIMLTPPLEMTLERGLEMMKGDEYLEVTPESVRLRKQFLNENERIQAARKAGK